MALIKRKAAPPQPSTTEDLVRDAPIRLDAGPEPEPAPTPDLAGQILRLRGEIESFVSAKTMELKQSRDGQSQPISALRAMLTRNDDCGCRVAMRVLSEQGK